ncbi:hypothetical protein [Oceanobacter kriegii]|uniref:hypothetical protein n=1 Tax=Oceanobacter kriegii TaxID=64972 RepID=UPI0012EC5309|nr:hypothetical protein [Oceanobacter kriegii]
MNETLIFSILLSSIGSVMICIWHETKGRELPSIEWVEKDVDPPQMKASETSQKDRIWFITSCLILGGFIGAIVGCYFLGFHTDRPFNNYAVSCVAMTAGFLMPNILIYLENLKIERLSQRYKSNHR